MARAGLAGLLLTTEAEVRYFSGFHTAFWQSPTRPWFLFLPVEGKPVAIIPEIGAALMRATWLDDIRSWPAPTPGDDGISLLTELLAPLVRQTALEANAACREQILARGAAAVFSGQGAAGQAVAGGSLTLAQHPYEKRRALITDLVDNYTVPYDDEAMLRLFAPEGEEDKQATMNFGT